MSDALNYLVQSRPEAMGHYLAFLKASGRGLDPKTRALISVITKVHAQTERGLRQYLKRALRDGCTPAEVLDALLMAFPALGLSKILWAVDVILAMDLAGFRLAESPPAAEPAWHDVMATRSLRVGAARRVAGDGRGLFVQRDAEGFSVHDSRCPHQGTDIPAAALAGCTLTCPQHGLRYDLRSGECATPGQPPLRRLPSRVEGGRLLVQW
jgi:nitrite reductase/ring-hydroxylating ferredoxin subunit/alkylhydroperoxidase/carboxymuconolactone decarboxylase family protein YurZ